MNEIKVGDKVTIRDFSGAVSGWDYGVCSFGSSSHTSMGIFEVTHVNMRLPSYDVTIGQNRVNTVVLRSTRDTSVVAFSQPQYLDKIQPVRVAKYKVLYQRPSSGDVTISTEYYMDLAEFAHQRGPLTPIHLIKETEKMV